MEGLSTYYCFALISLLFWNKLHFYAWLPSRRCCWLFSETPSLTCYTNTISGMLRNHVACVVWLLTHCWWFILLLEITPSARTVLLTKCSPDHFILITILFVLQQLYINHRRTWHGVNHPFDQLTWRRRVLLVTLRPSTRGHQSSIQGNCHQRHSVSHKERGRPKEYLVISSLTY